VFLHIGPHQSNERPSEMPSATATATATSQVIVMDESTLSQLDNIDNQGSRLLMNEDNDPAMMYYM
jgi:hypothetical protein